MNPHLHRYERLIESLVGNADMSATRNKPLVDSFGQTRDVDRPLLIYSRLIAGDVSPDLRNLAGTLDESIGSMLARQVAGEIFGEPSWIQQAGEAFAQLADQQRPSGEFLPADNSKNPESRWYEELVALHAAASYAVRSPSEKINNAVRRSAEFHLNETQPDHATAQPWGLLAFIQHATPLADQVLHAMQMQYTGQIEGIPLLLLADALYGLRRLDAAGVVAAATIGGD